MPESRGFAAVLPRFFACLKPHFPAQKIFYDLRLDLRFVCYNGCELRDIDYERRMLLWESIAAIMSDFLSLILEQIGRKLLWEV